MSTDQSRTNVSKPFAGYDDFDACVRDNPDKEDPEAFCAWLQDRAKEALSDPDAETVLTGLTTEFVSSVDEPAQRSEWLLFKDAETPRRRAKEVERPYVFPSDDGDGLRRPCKGEDPCEDGWVMVGTKPNPNGDGEVPDCVPEEDVDDPPNIESGTAGLPDDFDADEWSAQSKAANVDVRVENDDGERQIAYAAVLIPNEVDKQGDVIPPYVVERAAHEYMAEYRKMDSDHDLNDGAGVPVESWILKEDTSFETPDGDSVEYPEGTWVVAKRFVDDEWERVKSGELTGFSIYGGAEAVDADELADTVKSAQAKPNAPGESHGEEMKDALQAASKSDTPTATLQDRIQEATRKAEMADEDAEQVVAMLRQAAEAVEAAMGDGDAPEPDGEDTDEAEDGDDEDDEGEEMSNKQNDTDTMTDENSPNGQDGESNGDTDDVTDGIDELKSMVKGVDEKVDDFDDRLTEVEDEVDQLKNAVGDEPDSDRMDGGDVDDDVPENDRMKSVAKEAATEAVAEVAGVESDDPEVVRKGIREAAAGDATRSDVPDEDYGDIAEGVEGDKVTKSNTDGNIRLSGGGE